MARVYTSLVGRLAVAAAGVLLLAGAAVASEFTAQVVSSSTGMPVTTMKVYVKGAKERTVRVVEGQTIIRIVRRDKGVAWTLSPERKTYYATTGIRKGRSAGNPIKLQDKPYVSDVKRAGFETIAGYRCNKYVLTFVNPARGTEYVWISRKLDARLKMVRKSGRSKVSREYTNIKRTRLPDSLFEIPKGYKQVAAPKRPEHEGRGEGAPRTGGPRRTPPAGATGAPRASGPPPVRVNLPVVVAGDRAVRESLERSLRNDPEVTDERSQVKYHMQLVKPNPRIDYKIIAITPDPAVEYKIRLINPLTRKEIPGLSGELSRELLERLKAQR